MSIDAHTPQQYNQPKHNPPGKAILYIILFALTLVFIDLSPLILSNPSKGHFFISDAPFALPLDEYQSGLDNYLSGLKTTNFFVAVGRSLFVTVGPVIVIILFCAMTAYCITRVETRRTNTFHLLFVFSVVVPFQMVMFLTVKLADILSLDNLLSMILLYLGPGSSLSVFIFFSFVKSIPIKIEEAFMIDDCGPLQNHFRIVMPMFEPAIITVAILNTMWVQNDYLLPYLVIGLSTPYKTAPVVVQQLVGSHGSNDTGALMAMFVLTVIPIVVFYLFSQKYVIESVVAGAVEGRSSSGAQGPQKGFLRIAFQPPHAFCRHVIEIGRGFAMGTHGGHACPIIKDVVKTAGVDVVTVSGALDDKPEVPETARAKVLVVAEKMNYRPGHHVKPLKLSHNPAAALAVKDIDNLFFQQMLDTMETWVRERSYLLTLVKMSHWADEAEGVIKFIDEELIAGVILLSGSFFHEVCAFERPHASFVISTASRLSKAPNALHSSVLIGSALETEKAARHLIELGHTRIAVLGASGTDMSVGTQRVTGYRHTLAHTGIPVDEDLIQLEVLDQGNPYTLQYGYEPTKKLLAERPEATAILTIAGVLAVGAIRAVREAGPKVPEDISLVGFDGLPPGDFMDSRFTTLVQPTQRIARLTCDLLLGQVASDPSRHVFVPGTFHRDGSTGPVRTIR